MLFKLSLLRAFAGMMQGGNGAGNGPGNGGRPTPPATRTAFNHDPGDPQRKVEDKWELPGDSPIVTSWPFINWAVEGNPQKAKAARSAVAGAMILITRRPTAQQWQLLDAAPFLSTEADHDEGSVWAHEMDKIGAFDKVYPTFRVWKAAVPGLAALVKDPAAITRITLKEDSFATSHVWNAHAGPPSLAFLHRATVGDLLRANDSLSVEEYMPLALSRATVLFGSKDNSTERNDDSSMIRLAAGRVSSIMARMLDETAPSPANLAHKFPSVMAELQLPYMFSLHAITASGALRELDLAHKYTTGSSPQLNAIEKELILNVGQELHAVEPVVSRFNEPTQAFVQLERLTSQLLPATLSSSSTLVKLAELDTLLARAAWSATITHALNSDPTISGLDLVTMLIQSQTELSGGSAGNPGKLPADALSDDVAGSSSYGSVREQVLGDALRSDEARAALQEAEGLSGIPLVECLMQSKSVILTRAMLMQEAWLHNKAAALGFCSLAAPSICPYFAATFTEDPETGEVPDRLASYVWPSSELATARTPYWSKLRLLEQQLDINRLRTGTRYNAVSDADRYTVESCLRLQRDIGSRFCFALDLSLSPPEGFSFTDGVDLQLKAVEVARSLPAAECSEWLTWLSHEFATNWLDAGGMHYHVKLRSARCDHPDAQLSEYLPPSSIFVANVRARLRRAEPIADMRVAFPSLLASDSVSLPGTSGAVVTRQPGGKPPGGKPPGGKKPGGQPGDKPSGPGSKASFAYDISPQELFSCGTVFKKEEVAKHYNMGDVSKHCWAVIFSKKKGDAALELCPDHANHGGIKAKCHTRPSKFNLDYVYKNFTRQPTRAENEHADWKPSKKIKKA